MSFSTARLTHVSLASLVVLVLACRPTVPSDVPGAEHESSIAAASASTNESLDGLESEEPLPNLRESAEAEPDLIPEPVAPARAWPPLPETCPEDAPRRIILMIGDGLGPVQVEAAGVFAHGEAGSLSFESLPHAGMVSTRSANNQITDSAASATAMATGRKVNNLVVSLDLPGEEGPVETILQTLQRHCERRTGVVVTSTIVHATPAAFVAHNRSRNAYHEIAKDLFELTRPHVAIGGGGSSTPPELAANNGYHVITDRAGFEAFDRSSDQPVAALFGSSHLPYARTGDGAFPSLREMSLFALDVLDQSESGFFLMIEGARIDHAGHDNVVEDMVFETVEFHHAAEAVIAWVAENSEDTLLIVTSDHETGGMAIVEHHGQGVYPTVTWSTGHHTDVDVPYYAIGPGADRIPPLIDNTDIYRIMMGRLDEIVPREPAE